MCQFQQMTYAHELHAPYEGDQYAPDFPSIHQLSEHDDYQGCRYHQLRPDRLSGHASILRLQGYLPYIKYETDLQPSDQGEHSFSHDQLQKGRNALHRKTASQTKLAQIQLLVVHPDA